MELTLDFRLIEIEYELWALGEYLNTLEQQLPVIAEEKRIQTYARLQAEKLDWNDPETEFAFQELYEFAENILPRLFYGPFLITLWAVYESAITEIVDYLKRQQKKTKSLRGVQGNFLERAQKYFNDILAFPLCTDNRTWDRLEILMALRHALAHANGRMEMVSGKPREKIEKWIKTNTGVMVKNGRLLFVKAFVHEIYALVRESLISLIERVRSTY